MVEHTKSSPLEIVFSRHKTAHQVMPLINLQEVAHVQLATKFYPLLFPASWVQGTRYSFLTSTGMVQQSIAVWWSTCHPTFVRWGRGPKATSEHFMYLGWRPPALKLPNFGSLGAALANHE